MSADIRIPGRRDSDRAGSNSALLARARAQLAALRGTNVRVCPLCREPIRGGQELERMHGTTVHARCTHDRTGGAGQAV